MEGNKEMKKKKKNAQDNVINAEEKFNPVQEDGEISDEQNPANEYKISDNKSEKPQTDFETNSPSIDENIHDNVNSSSDITDDEQDNISSSDEQNSDLKPVPEIVANTKEEKKLLEEKNTKLKAIEELEEKNIVLEKEAVKFENLASTIDTEPFKELKQIVSDAAKTYIDRSDIKEAKKKIKNLEAIDSMEQLLNEYKELADENRQNITANINEIEGLKDKIAELDDKLCHFQTKLDI